VKDHIITDKKTATRLLISYINEGQLIVGHRGHGRWTGWREPKFMIEDIESITSDYPGVLFNINCRTGRFHYSDQNSFAEKILKNRGTPSLIAANFLSYRWRNDNMAKALFDAIWPGIIPSFPKTNARYPVKNRRLGDILNYAKAYLLVKHGANRETKEQIEMYHVVGDPTLEIWEDEPSAVRLYARIMEDTLYIKMSTCPMDAVLTIWCGDELLDSKKPPSSTWIPVALKDLKKDPPYSICFSAPGYRFTEVTAYF
jgi:hypothetical protein